MKKLRKYLPVLFPATILLVVLLLGYCSKANAESEAVKALKDFVIENRPETPPDALTPQTGSAKPGKPHRPASPDEQVNQLRDIGNQPDSGPALPLSSGEQENDDTYQVADPALEQNQSPAEKIIGINFPLRIGYAPEALHSLSILRKDERYYGQLNIQLYAGQYKDLEIANKWIGELKVLDPIIEGGFTATLDSKDFLFHLGLRTELAKNDHSIGFRVLFQNHSYKQILKTTYGRLFVYYNYSKSALVNDEDIASFYVGWYSPHLYIDLKNLDSFTAQFNGLIKQSENLIAGIYYTPDVNKKLSYSVEVGPDNLSASVYYAIR